MGGPVRRGRCPGAGGPGLQRRRGRGKPRRFGKDPLFDFRRYLRRFTVPREELETDEDSFDSRVLHLGMERYGNMSAGASECQGGCRLDAFAIAIDTSASCDAVLVRRFLVEVYGILSTQENFFRKMKVVFFQCDCCLQEQGSHYKPGAVAFLWKKYKN